MTATPIPTPDAPAEDGDPYAEGVEAHDTNRSQTDNPYDLDTQWDNHCSWNDGFAAAIEAATDDAMEDEDGR